MVDKKLEYLFFMIKGSKNIKNLDLEEFKKSRKINPLASTCCHIIRDEAIKISIALYKIKANLEFDLEKYKNKRVN